MKEKKQHNIFIEGAISPVLIADSIAKHATKTGIGAHSIFLGQVRADSKAGGTVSSIEYTAYPEMVQEKMYVLREMLFAKYQLSCMHVYHSLGIVPAGQICLFVFVSSVHRKAATEACAELVEAIKAELPVWGREILDNQASEWKQNR